MPELTLLELNAKLAEENENLREWAKNLQEENERLHEELLDAAREMTIRAEPDFYR